MNNPGYSFRAVNREVNNMDLREGWNVFYYHNPDTDQWSPVPWDLDMLYGPTANWSGVIDMQNSILQHSELMRKYPAIPAARSRLPREAHKANSPPH